MAYTKQTWDTTSYVNPTRMNHIEEGIKAVDNVSGKVTQTPTSNENKAYRMMVSGTNDDNEETNVVRKATGFTFNPVSAFLQLIKKHSETTTQAATFDIGNNVTSGSDNATYGELRIFGQGQYCGKFWDRYNTLTGNRQYELPDKNGVLALTTDGIGKYSFYAGTTSHTITFSGTGRLRCASYILICAGASFISAPIVISFKGTSTGTGEITGVNVSENNIGVTASDFTVTIPALSSSYGTHTLFQLYPDDNITYTTT